MSLRCPQVVLEKQQYIDAFASSAFKAQGYEVTIKKKEEK